MINYMNVLILPAFSAAVDSQLLVCLVAIIRVTNSYGARTGPKVLKDHTVSFTATASRWHTAVQSCYVVEVFYMFSNLVAADFSVVHLWLSTAFS